MLSLPKIYMCLGLTALLILRASGQRNRYSNNNNNNNNRNGAYSSGSTQVGDISSPEEEGKFNYTIVLSTVRDFVKLTTPSTCIIYVMSNI